MWAPTQNPQAVQDTVAAARRHRQEGRHLPRDAARRRLRPQVEAGLRGRSGDAVEEARQAGEGVWTREDDIQFDFYHTTAAVYHKAAVDGRGQPTAWLQRSAFPPIASTFGRTRASRSASSSTWARPTLPFDVPNIRAENGPADAHVRIGWFRAVANNYHAFAAHSFADEMAHAAGRDSLEFLLDMIGPGKVIDLKAQGVDYSNYGAPIDKYPVDTPAAAPRARSGRREVQLGQAQAGQRLGHRHRRAPQLQHLRRVGGRSRSRRAGRRARFRASIRSSTPASSSTPTACARSSRARR